jgi:hypothetical protein
MYFATNYLAVSGVKGTAFASIRDSTTLLQ